jgi:NAD(P)-dependent dehydrogenase (short-subunit alcohol dehydrogenase family)
MTRDHGVEGAVVIVTGAGRGVGRGIAHHLARNGARVVIADVRADRLARCAGELEGLGTECLAAECDVGDRAAVFALVERALARFGRVDGLVNNAQGLRPTLSLAEVRTEDMDVLFDTGPKAALWGMQAVFPAMRAQGFGRIVNVASASGLAGLAGYGPYNAAKEAIRALTRTAAREFARHGIVVNCFCPAATGHRRPPGDEASFQKEAWDRMYAHHPMGRDGDPEHDIAPVVLFLLSPACRFLTGETLKVDGGGYMCP